MEKLSLKKKLLIIRLYLEGLSYDEIAARTNVGKGTVFNVITELKAGRFPEYGDLSEQLELLRELAIDLRRSRITPVQAAAGITVLSCLQELEVEPDEIEGFSALYRTLTAEGADVQSFIRTGLYLEEERERTGLDLEELETKVKSLEESSSRLEPLARKVAERELELTELDGKCQSLVKEESELEDRYEILEENVRNKEQRETELSNRVRELEDRAQSADERLTTARRDLRILSGLGMPPDKLSAFTQRLEVIAQRHGIKSEVLCSRLMEELEQLDKGLGLDTIVKDKKQELRRLEKKILKMREESEALNTTNEKLRQERSSLRAELLEERRYIVTDIKAINVTARSTITKLKEDLGIGVRDSITEVYKLRNQALSLGRELGQFDEMIESNKWLKGLQALTKGDEEVEPDQIRVIGITIMKAILNWLNRHSQDSGVPWLIRPSLSNLIGDLERWK
ncbi:helix-turn-helix domain-containing protein, partial [Chloroflexota bacterium]